MSWADPQDVIDRWVGPGAPTDEDMIQRWIDDAETVLRYEVPDIEARLDEGTLTMDTVVFVVCRMVIRVLRNPRGVRQEGVGPFNVTYTGDKPGDLWLTDDERAMLEGQPRRRQTAFTIDPTPAGAWTPRPPDPWGSPHG
jgi:hypothetical protein